MKYNKVLSALVGLSLIGAASCTDEFNDHYASMNGINGGGSLWEVITNNPEYSNFAKVLQATEYDRDLAGSQVFTVFAPNNSVLTDDMAQSLIDSFKVELAKDYGNNPLKRAKTATVKEFVQSHIALYNYSVASNTDTVVRMMNGKFLKLQSGSFDGNSFATTNNTTGNGVFFGVNGVAEYLPSAFEAIKTMKGIDSLRNFVYMEKPYMLHQEKIDEKKSVPGDIVAGKQTYLDSVTIIQNDVLSALLAKLDNEDSTYYCVFPTNNVWKEQVARNEEMFQYAKDEPSRDSLMYVMPRLALLKGTHFSKTINPNLGVTTDIDSVKSAFTVKYENRRKVGEMTDMVYEYAKPYQAGGIFDGTTEFKTSNGLIYIADKWNFKRNNGFLTSCVMEAENKAAIYAEENTDTEQKEYYNSCSWEVYNVASDNEQYYNKVSDHKIACMAPEANQGKVLLQFDGAYSNVDYDMFVYTVPATARDTSYASTAKEAHFKCKLFSYDTKGNMVEKEITEADGGDMTEYDYEMVFETSATDLKKIKIGTFRFDACTYGSSVHKLKLELESCTSSMDVGTGVYDKNIYIDKIVLVPHEE